LSRGKREFDFSKKHCWLADAAISDGATTEAGWHFPGWRNQPQQKMPIPLTLLQTLTLSCARHRTSPQPSTKLTSCSIGISLAFWRGWIQQWVIVQAHNAGL
jgi:hypothetical protein